MSEPRSKDFHIRAAVVRGLLACGVARSDILHELTLDTYSSGGRVDLAVLNDNRLIGIELKSGSDVLDRCEDQMAAMDRAFDAWIVVADIRLVKKRPASVHRWVFYRHADGLFTQYPEEHGFIGQWHPFQSRWIGALSGFDARGTSPIWMASTLWADEARALAGGRTREIALKLIRENYTLKQVREHVVKTLRARPAGKWSEAFWRKFDAAASMETAA